MKSYESGMCHGPWAGKILRFAMPVMLTYILQLLFNAADLVVIGHYSDHMAMAAIGATMNLNSLVINVFIGLAVGTNVVVAHYFGAKKFSSIHAAVHTSIAVAFWGGIGLMIIGLFVAKPLLVLMKTPEEVLPLSCTYIWICFGAIPFIMLYNFGCSILRAVGDTRRPLIFLVIAGLVNVVLNLFFVIGCGMSVGGVALATAISHCIAATLILRTLMKSRENYHLNWRECRVDWKIFRQILQIGVPAGIQSSCFAVSNMLIQSSINSFGATAMAGTTAVLGVEGIVYVGSYAFHQTAISFVAQNLGARKYKRILKSLYGCFVFAIIGCSILGFGFFLAGKYVLSIFNPNPEVIAWGILRMKILFTTYGLCGIMDVASGGLRGLGYSVFSTVISLLGACVFRIWWVVMIFPHNRTMENLLYSYPISWALVSLIGCITLFAVYRRILHRHCRISTPWRWLHPSIPKGLRYIGGAK